MMETQYDQLIFGLVVFLFEVMQRIINVCVSISILYCVGILIGKYVLCKGDQKEWDELGGYIRDGVKDAAAAFRNAMPAIKESAKHWSDEKIKRIRRE